MLSCVCVCDVCVHDVCVCVSAWLSVDLLFLWHCNLSETQAGVNTVKHSLWKKSAEWCTILFCNFRPTRLGRSTGRFAPLLERKKLFDEGN